MLIAMPSIGHAEDVGNATDLVTDLVAELTLKIICHNDEKDLINKMLKEEKKEIRGIILDGKTNITEGVITWGTVKFPKKEKSYFFFLKEEKGYRYYLGRKEDFEEYKKLFKKKMSKKDKEIFLRKLFSLPTE